VKQGGKVWMDWLRIGINEHCNELSGSIKVGEFLD
jgi:hypothetical protein